MRASGYWIECVPSAPREDGAYVASVDVFPDIAIHAETPDQAVDRMRQKLLTLRQDYLRTGRLLPKTHSPTHPPTRHRTIQGWLSVYIDLES